MGAGIRVAVVGAGYWGINHVRVMAGQKDADLTWVCDSSTQQLARASSICPTAKTTSAYQDVLEARDVDAVVLVTPAVSHAEMTLQALRAGKHVFVEKPLSLDYKSALEVEAVVKETGLTLMVGHLMLYHPAVEKLRELVWSGELGDIYYLYGSRVNLGRLRTDENALWSLAPHDVSMIDYLLGDLPSNVSARGECYLQPGIEDVVFVSMKFAGKQMAQVHLSWLDPHKERKMTVVGSRKMVVFDDVSPEKLRIYDKGYAKPPTFQSFDQYLTLRHGDINIPHLAMQEPLGKECAHYLACIRDGATPRTNIAHAIRVVRVLEAAQRSLDAGGKPVNLEG